MNGLERQMVALLADLRAQHHVVAVKAEFETEGTRLDEAMRLKDLATRAGLGLVIKVGGCEAVRDMYDAAALGIETLVAPMVETPYALSKFTKALERAFPADARDDVACMINVETATTCHNLEAMLKSPAGQAIDGIVIGRSDLACSMGLKREDTDHPAVLEAAMEAAKKAKENGLKVVLGGGVTPESFPHFRRFPAGNLDRIETRKVVFACPRALDNPEAALRNAIAFEVLWLQNKKAHYGRIHVEDDARLQAFERRYGNPVQAGRY